MRLFAILFVIAASHSFFYVIPNQALAEASPTIGLLVLFALVSYQIFLERNHLGRLNTFIVWYVFVYLLLVLAQASLASFHFEQSIIDGLIVARSQFQYLVAIALILYFRSDEDIERFMSALSILVVFILVLSLFNYFGPTILHHKWAEGHGVRAGIVRAYIPALELFVLVAIWQFNRFIHSPRTDWIALFFILATIFGILFRQTKMHILVTLLVIILMLVQKRRFGVLAVGAFALVAISGAMTTPTGDNLLFSTFQQAYDSVVYPEKVSRANDGEKSTWASRMEQIERAEHLVSEHFLTGSGGMVLRETEEGAWSREKQDARRGMDLGYFVWVKFYGLPGVLLMTLLTLYLGVSCFRLISRSDTPNRYIVFFVAYEYLVIMISMVTIGYFTLIHAINTLCICLAVLGFKVKQKYKPQT